MDYDEETEKLLKDEYREILWNHLEANELLEEIEITIREVQESEFYRTMLQQLQNSPHFQNNIHRVLGGGSSSGDIDNRLQMVIYGLGTIQFNYRSHYQLAMAISLTSDLSHWIKETISTFDPCTTPIDAKVKKMLGCAVEYVNERLGRRGRPTLFYMPFVNSSDLWNLLEVNWRPSDLNKIILFTNVYEGLEKTDLYAKTILKRTIKFDCHYSYEGPVSSSSEWPFYDMTCHFFNLLPETKLEMPRMRRHQENNPEVLDEDKCLTYCLPEFRHSMFTTLPGHFEGYAHALEEERESWLEDMLDSRLPTWPGRFKWFPPYNGWIKLNFSASVATTNYNLQQSSREVVGYGAFFHNDKSECLLSYPGPPLDDLDEEDVMPPI